MSFTSPEFWIALLQIIGVNIVLSGDNAVVIALAARGLPVEHQKKAVAWGSGAAVVMRIVLTLVAVEMLRLPYLKLAGAGLLVWIAIQLLLPGDEEGPDGTTSTTVASAIKTILLADLVMSLDNVIGVAAAAKGDTVLLIAGLAISIPLVIFASRLLLTLMDRFPIIITMGAALLGWVAGDMAVSDPVVKPWVDLNAAYLHWAAPLAGAIVVVTLGKWLAARKAQASSDATAAAVASGESKPVPAIVGTGWARRVLVAVDGSDGAAEAVQRALALRQQLRNPADMELHVINVQRSMTGDVSTFVAASSIESYQQERSDTALVPARTVLAAAGVPFEEHTVVGVPGPAIAETAKSLGCDLIVLGSRGLGGHAAALLGSVVQEVLQHATVPVLVAK